MNPLDPLIKVDPMDFMNPMDPMDPLEPNNVIEYWNFISDLKIFKIGHFTVNILTHIFSPSSVWENL